MVSLKPKWIYKYTLTISNDNSRLCIIILVSHPVSKNLPIYRWSQINIDVKRVCSDHILIFLLNIRFWYHKKAYTFLITSVKFQAKSLTSLTNECRCLSPSILPNFIHCSQFWQYTFIMTRTNCFDKKSVPQKCVVKCWSLSIVAINMVI